MNRNPPNPYLSMNNQTGGNHVVNGAVRSICIASDYGGCGHYRIFWPNQVLSAKHPQKKNGIPAYHIDNCTSLNFDHMMFYNWVNVVRLQRSSSKEHMTFLKDFLMPMSSSRNFRIAVDYDDWFFSLPKFNVARGAYPPDVLSNTAQIMRNVHYITTSTTYLKKLIVKHIKVHPSKVIVIPNRLPKFLYDGFYERNRERHLEKGKITKKPTILWTGSSSHVNLKEPGQQDDLTVIRRLLHSPKYNWVFLGLNKDVAIKKLGLPKNAKYLPWVDILSYPKFLSDIEADVALVPLYECDFNRAKSNIKLLEYGSMAMPAIYQDIEPYKFAPIKAKTTEDYEAEIDKVLADPKYRDHAIKKQKSILDKNFWLEGESSIAQYRRFYAGNINSLLGENETIV
jgi:hypothetical protein